MCIHVYPNIYHRTHKHTHIYICYMYARCLKSGRPQILSKITIVYGHLFSVCKPSRIPYDRLLNWLLFLVFSYIPLLTIINKFDYLKQ